MQTRETDKAINIASFATLVAALVLSLPVIERLIGALWQWYKFAGYSNDGHISLSLNSGLLFSGLLAVIFGLALWFNRIARRRSVPRAQIWSYRAMCIATAAAASYWLLGMSVLNAWRA